MEITARNGIIRPPLNFLSILNEAGIKIDTSSPDKLCDQLYAGIFLKPKLLKYFVDKKLNKNCFLLFARELTIDWGDNSEYWIWTYDKDASGEDIEVAELLKVCWLKITGMIWTVNLSPGTLYEIIFVVKVKEGGNVSNFSLNLSIIPHHLERIIRHHSLEEDALGNWIEIQVGEFKMSPEMVGNMIFHLEEATPEWKHGLLVKCAIIRPKN
ncbi:hypothetical protein ACJW31_08G046500 [Castanea mollissima]